MVRTTTNTMRHTRKAIILSALCVGTLIAGTTLTGAGPADAQAAVDRHAVDIYAPIHVHVHSATLVPGVTVDQLLELKLQWSCLDDAVLIERTTGTVHIDTPDGGTVEIETSVKDVRPGNDVVTTVQIEWDEFAQSHRTIRRDVDTVTATWSPDAMRTVVVDAASTPRRGQSSEPIEGPVRNTLH